MVLLHMQGTDESPVRMQPSLVTYINVPHYTDGETEVPRVRELAQ